MGYCRDCKWVDHTTDGVDKCPDCGNDDWVKGKSPAQKKAAKKLTQLTEQRDIAVESLEYIANPENIGNDSMFILEAKEAIDRIRGMKCDL